MAFFKDIGKGFDDFGKSLKKEGKAVGNSFSPKQMDKVWGKVGAFYGDDVPNFVGRMVGNTVGSTAKGVASALGISPTLLFAGLAGTGLLVVVVLILK